MRRYHEQYCIRSSKGLIGPNCDVLSILRKAHIIANKLQLLEFDTWIISELNGYSPETDTPDYRKVSGSLKAWNPYHGWIPVILNDKRYEDLLCNREMRDSLGDLIKLEDKSKEFFYMYFDAETSKILNSVFAPPFPTRYSIQIGTHKLNAIIEQVKNTILEWTIKLENEGILGEDMRFSLEEKETAKQIPQTVNNYYGNTNVINAPLENSAIVAGDDNSIAFTYEKAKEMTSEIESALKSENLSEEDQETVIEMLSEIKDKITQQKNHKIIKSAFIGLRDFLISAGASATVALIQAKMQGLL